MSLQYLLKNTWYNLKCRFWHKYSTVKPRTLSHTWVDRDMLMYHCMFEILSQFIEKELKPLTLENVKDEVDYDNHEMIMDQYEKEQELIALYDWWHKEFVPNQNTIEFWTEDGMHNTLMVKAKRLIDLSPNLWT